MADKKDDVFAIRCFLNGKRKMTHELTKAEAKHFLQASLHLADYLKKEYKVSSVNRQRQN